METTITGHQEQPEVWMGDEHTDSILGVFPLALGIALAGIAIMIVATTSWLWIKVALAVASTLLIARGVYLLIGQYCK